MFSTSSHWLKTLLLAGLALAVVSPQGVLAQQGRRGAPQSGQSPQSGRQGETQQPKQASVGTQESEPFIHGVSVGAGLAIYQGDYSLNPNHNVVKYIAGNGRLSFRFGLDHRRGQYDQYGFGADLVYNRLSGETTGDAGFSANSLALDFYADYELPYIEQGLLRVFVGGGPNFIISPSYTGNPVSLEENAYQELGTRVIGSLKAGVTIMDALRVGTRVASTDLLDGYKGFDPGPAPDFVSFINISYRFSVK